MKNNLLAKIICVLAVCLIVVGAFPYNAKGDINTVGEAKSVIDGIIDFKLKQSGESSVQNWLNDSLTANAGISSEWYVIALSQYGNYDLSSYESALKTYLKNNTVYSATSRQKYALALIASGSCDSYIAAVLEDSIGQQGIMSWIYGLHLLNNGYKSNSYSLDQVKQKILSLQLGDGGWAISGTNGDNDVTAMTIQALAPYYAGDSSVKSAVDRALSLLSQRQLNDGDYSSYGVPNPESTAQVITALSSLGIDFAADSRFIKNGNTLIDGLKKYALSDGSFTHQQGGAANDTATVQALYSLVSYVRMSEGKSSLYILDKRNPSGLITNTTPDTGSQKGESLGSGSSSYENEGVNNSNTQQSSVSTTGSASGVSQSEENSISAPAKTETIEKTPEPEKKSTETPKDKAFTDTPESTPESTTASTDVNADSSDIGNKSITNGVANKKSVGYKPLAIAIIMVLGVISSIGLFIAKKRNKKNFIAIWLIVIIAIIIVIVTDFQSTEEYYGKSDIDKANPIGSVTMTIRCDTVVGKSDSEYIPKDGVVLENTEFEIEEGETAYDILIEAARLYNIQIENTGAEGMVYIAGINYLYEFDFGDVSGWMYFVNDESPSVGCDEYVLEDGDSIEWLYTCELGKDLE